MPSRLDTAHAIPEAHPDALARVGHAAAPRDASPCAGCGLVLRAHDGPTHPYIGASPACWARFGELLALGLHRVAVDVYAVQHPGVPERRAIQSVGVHLMVLCLALERSEPDERLTPAVQRLLARRPALHWLDPPRPNGTITVADVLAAGTAEAALDWARDVWAAWAPHHATVRAWLDALR